MCGGPAQACEKMARDSVQLTHTLVEAFEQDDGTKVDGGGGDFDESVEGIRLAAVNNIMGTAMDELRTIHKFAPLLCRGVPDDATWRALRHDVANAVGSLAIIGTLKADGGEQEKKKVLKSTHASILEKKLVVPQVLWQRLEATLGL